MKLLVYAIVAAIIVTACGGVKIQQHNLPCHSRGKSEIIQAATALLVQQGLKITMADTLVGLVQAESEEQRDVWSGMYIKRYWQVSVRPTIGPLGEVKPADQESLSKPKHPKPMFIIATAKTTTQSRNVFGATIANAEHYYDDEAHRDWEWYWSVRDGLESICDAKVIITTKKMN
jgi:hypothetical protein